ncbi:MAG: SDR family oxidoreductase [Bacilli bacterium]|nr:SDR family oxidoreductase [Bacilli bacterium]
MVVFITGGLSSIGKEITKYLLDNHHTVYLNYLTSDPNIFNEYPNIIKVPGDINDDNYLIETFKLIKANHQQLDLIINNACFCQDDLIGDKTKESLLKEINTNLVAPYMIIKYYQEYFSSGKIINMLSTDGIDTYNEYNSGYALSKAGLLNLTKSMAYSLKDFKVYGLVLNYVKTDSVLAMNPDFLNKELTRINQKELIEVNTVIKHIDKLINGDFDSGYIERVDGNE